jgi:hypothetical protein
MPDYAIVFYSGGGCGVEVDVGVIYFVYVLSMVMYLSPLIKHKHKNIIHKNIIHKNILYNT